MAEGDGCAGEGIFSFSFVYRFMYISKCEALVMLVRMAHIVVNSSRDNLLQQAVFFFFLRSVVLQGLEVTLFSLETGSTKEM